MHWSSLTPTEREREYSPSSCIGGNYQPFIAAYTAHSHAAMAQTQALGAQWSQHGYRNENLKNAPKTAPMLRLCTPRQQTQGFQGNLGFKEQSLPPLLIFIHGGYWQELSAADSLFAATGCVQHGAAFAALDYTLAPHASVAQMVDECRQGLTYLSQNAAALGFDAQRMVLAGSSAGAHLAAMVAQTNGQQAYTLRGAVLVSGIYALEPLVGTTINEALGLNASTAQALSPTLRPSTHFPETVVCYGAVETAEFKRQSQAFAAQLQCESAANQALSAFEVPQRNHFDVILDLTDVRTRLGQATLQLLQT